MDEKQERVIFYRDVYDLPSIDDFIVEFKFNDTTVYTKGNQLIVESIKTIDSIDSPLEIKRYTRPDLLVVQGILCYFTGHLFTIYEIKEGETQILERGINPSKNIECTIFSLEGLDQSKDLNSLLEKLKDSRFKTLIITLLDRWRKALYMVAESEVDTYHDEAILTHFHILELLVSYYYNDFKEEANEEIKSFLTLFSSEILNQSGKARENTINSKLRILKEVLISDEASIATKINYFLKRHSMLDEHTYSLVNKIVKIRNSIAHGRMSYKEKLIWPLPPFFNISSIDTQMIISQIQILTARAIAVHLGLDSWKEAWGFIHNTLPPSDEVLMNLLKSPEQITGSDLIDGTYRNITVESLVDYYIDNRSKFSLTELEQVISKTLIEIPINEENSAILFLASVLLSDSDNEELSSISKNNVELVHKYDWYGYSNIKDIVRYFDFYDIEVKWLYSWIEDGGHIEAKRS
ncbi:hypothetical protein [Neobacillus jeddahensis]|uniref:hypothetical protein n=1 Tax=Neobacillus jeddahensis TaxID=1461580 RepID=UPI00058AE69B|nr:hypothetical protein [Neobacillus jeddahensis]